MPLSLVLERTVDNTIRSLLVKLSDGTHTASIKESD